MKGRGWWLAVLVALAGVLAAVLIRPEPMMSPGPMLKGHEALSGDCFACHAPLRGSPLARCVSCHAVEAIGLRTTQGLALIGSPERPPFHQQLIEAQCTACHGEHEGSVRAGSLRPFSHALLKPEVRESCAGCHRKPEGGLHSTFTAGCQQCHQVHGWKPATFAHDRYFRLEGEHAVSCQTCHIGEDFSRSSCYGCHEHQPARIRSQHAEEGIRDIEHCARCHRSGEEESGD